MLLLVGLGNPGPRYAKHRHNIGFMALDAIADRHGFQPWRKRFQGEVAEGKIAGQKVIALKPQTYMNESGRAVGEAARFYKIPLSDIVVFHDELDLAAGKVKLKTGGGAAGHNGLRSIDAHLGANFKRVRLGIGHPGDKSRVHGHVLGDFAKADQDWLERLMDALVFEAPALVENTSQGDSLFMSRVNQAIFPQRPNKPKGDKASGKSQSNSQTAASKKNKDHQEPAGGQSPKAPEPGDAALQSIQARQNEPEGLLAQALKAAQNKFGGKKKESDS
ncbi:aminoacyl-tRNA hydrolase [Rhodovibrionaceae bacterium A322]